MNDVSEFAKIINYYLPEPNATLLNGIIFGIKISKGAFYLKLKKVGLLHLVVLSGLNITILSSIVAYFTKSFGKKLSILITIISIILFICFVGVEAPVVRAGIMGILTLVAVLYDRENITLLSLLYSLVFIFFIWPEWFKSLSLYLSYSATLGIILFGNSNTKNIFWKEMKPSIAAQLFTIPIIFIYFKEISLISPIATLLVAFTVPILMILGFLIVFFAKINILFGFIPAYICFGLTTYVIFIIDLLEKIPFVFFSFK